MTNEFDNMTQQERNYTANLIRTLRSNGVGVRLAKDGELTDIIAKDSLNSRIDFLQTKDHSIYGWFSNGEIHLTKEGFNPNTPLHEYTHAFMLALQNEDPPRYANIVSELKTTGTWNKVLADKAYANISNNEARIASEVAARIVGNESQKRASENLSDKLVRALQDLLDYIKEKIGLQVPFTPEKFASTVIKDISNPDNALNTRFLANFENRKVNSIPIVVYDLLQKNHGKEYADLVSNVVDMNIDNYDGNLQKSYSAPSGIISNDSVYNKELAKAASLVTGEDYNYSIKEVISFQENSNSSIKKNVPVPPSLQPYISSLSIRSNILSGDANLLPKAIGDKYEKWESATEDYVSMKESGLSAIEDIKAQRNLVSESYRDFKKSLYENLGISNARENSVIAVSESFFEKNGQKVNTSNFAQTLLDAIINKIDSEVEANKAFVSQNYVEMMAVQKDKTKGNTQQNMSKKNYSANSDRRSAEDRALDKFAELMIEKIESIQQDWKKPWFTPGAVQVPKNLSGREYNGMNSIILMMQQEKNGWQANRYATHDRFAALNYSKDKYGITPAKDAEGNKLPQVLVNKGEKSTPVFITVFSVVDPETKEKIKYDDYKQMSEEERAKYNVYPKLQVYNVFNVDQTNLKEARPELYDKLMQEGKGPELNDASKMEKFPAIDAMIEQDVWACPIKPTFGDDAYYSISKDEIVIPKKEQFVDGEAFYSNLLHEMAHSTGAESRLDRLKPSSFGSKDYAKEELVAELTAALVSTQNGLSKHVKDDSAAYLKNWLDSLKEEPSFVKNVLMDVKRAASFTNQRIAAVSERLERDGPNADMSDLREKNKSFAPSYSALKPQTSPEQKEQEPAVEDKQTENKEQVARQTASFRR